MRAFVMGIVIFLNFIFQSTILNNFQIVDIKPNTSVLLIVTYALLRGDVEGSIFGFFSGLLQDIFFGKVIGLYAALGFLTGFICGKPFKDFYRENFLIAILSVGLSCVVYEFAFYIIFFLFQGKINLFYYFGRIILPEAVYTVLVTIPIYRIVYEINQRLERNHHYSNKLF